MSVISTFTNDLLTGKTWSSTNKSDSWTNAEIDGGSITRKLGNPSVETKSTAVYTSNGSAVNAHVGTWVTESSPESITIPQNSSFGFNWTNGYEEVGQLNAYVFYKISIVTESANVLSFNRTVVDWTAVNNNGTPVELGLVSGSHFPMGNGSGTGVNTHFTVPTGDTLAVGERIAIEVAIQTVGRNGNTMGFEYGSHSNHPDDPTLVSGNHGTGSYGTEVIMPITLSETYQDLFGGHAEFHVPTVAGTDTIAWADIGSDWSVAKWQTTNALRLVSRLGGTIRAQTWMFQDDDYFYLSCNNIDDTCIQSSDHHYIAFFTSSDFATRLSTNNTDWLFKRDITSGVSRAPSLPTAIGDNVDAGEYVLQGDGSTAYPRGWEVPTYSGTPHTCTFSNAKAFVDGVDWRAGGSGATSTAPNPNGGNSGGSYSEFKIKKTSIGWDGSTPIGMIIGLQCDVQGAGNTMFPTLLGVQVDKNDWNIAGTSYPSTDGATASSKVSSDDMDLRPLMSIHAHGDAQGTNLVVGDGTHSLTSDNATLTSKYSLTVDSSTHSHTVEEVAVTPSFTVIVNDTIHSLTSDNVDVNVKYIVTINDSIHSVVSDNVVLGSKYNLVSNDSSHTLVSENVELSFAINVVPNGTTHSLTSDSVTITEHKYNVVVNDSSHIHNSDNVVLNFSINISVDNSQHNLTSENVVLASSYNVTVQDSSHSLASDNVVLSSKYNLSVADSSHALASDNITITEHKYNVVTNDTSHNVSSDNITLGFGSTLTINNSLHPHFSQNVVLSSSYSILTNNTSHSHNTENVELTSKYLLSVGSAVHTHNVDNINIISKYNISTNDSTHTHTVDSVVLQHKYNLQVSNSLHSLSSNNITLEGVGLLMFVGNLQVSRMYLGNEMVQNL